MCMAFHFLVEDILAQSIKDRLIQGAFVESEVDRLNIVDTNNPLQLSRYRILPAARLEYHRKPMFPIKTRDLRQSGYWRARNNTLDHNFIAGASAVLTVDVSWLLLHNPDLELGLLWC